MRILHVEIERALRRQLVWVLVAVAITGIAAMAVVAFATSTGLAAGAHDHPAVMRDWWRPGGGDGPIVVGALFLMVGAVIGGSSMTGADWRAGTLPTLLTWEPRRGRLAAARLAACASCAAVIALALQALMLVALLPAVLTHGTTAGVDGAWWLGLAAAMARVSVATAFAAVVAASVALAARNTAAAIVACAVWLTVIENLLRGVKPWTARYLVVDSVVRFVGWADIARSPDATRSPLVATMQLFAYLAVLVAVSTWWFTRRDAVAA